MTKETNSMFEFEYTKKKMSSVINISKNPIEIMCKERLTCFIYLSISVDMIIRIVFFFFFEIILIINSYPITEVKHMYVCRSTLYPEGFGIKIATCMCISDVLLLLPRLAFVSIFVKHGEKVTFLSFFLSFFFFSKQFQFQTASKFIYAQ